MIPKKTDCQVYAFFILLSWGHMLFETRVYMEVISNNCHSLLDCAFHGLAYPCYCFIYLMPAVIVISLLRLISNKSRILAAGAIVMTTLCILFIRVDGAIFDLYRFHFNGFVINLLFTPGGLESLGTDESSYIGIGIIIFQILIIQIIILGLSRWLAGRKMIIIPSWHRYAIACFILAFAVIQVIYGASDLYNYGSILETSRVYPFYVRTTFRSLAEKIGVVVNRSDNIVVKRKSGALKYPIKPIEFHDIDRAPNIVWLVTESLRADRLTSSIMPNTWKFAGKSQRFTQHYSTGNGTREGVFGMFYGLYGANWSKFLHAKRSPLLLDRMQSLNYQFDIRTSACFTYPEFDQTLFVNIPSEFLHEQEFDKQAWERDEKNTSSLIAFLRNRDSSRPCMAFMFYESSHARYTFPPSQKIYGPVLEKVDYSNMKRSELHQYIDQLENRYNNAVHWVDIQLGRIFDCLETMDMLDDTIVIVTGDHGEEFMENGFWGHNSSFVEEQIRTPLVVSIPGKTQDIVNRVTSHMDIAVTLMQLLGAANQTVDYSLGQNLFDTTPRDYITLSDWSSICIVTSDLKYTIPYDNRRIAQYIPTRPDDTRYPGKFGKRIINENRKVILNAIQNFSRFTL